MENNEIPILPYVPVLLLLFYLILLIFPMKIFEYEGRVYFFNTLKRIVLTPCR